MTKRPCCTRCLRPQSHCLCADIPDLHSATELLVLQHPSEQHHALNTARLLCLGLDTAHLLVAEHVPDDWMAWLQDADYRTELLFPGPDAGELASTSDGRPRRLVLLDGTWRKARKLYYLNPVLHPLPQVALPAGPPSRYRLRKSPGAEALSTLEAGVRALGILEPAIDFTPLLRPFERLIDGQIAAMGTLTYQAHFAHRGAGKPGKP
ncbi:tRNA-uridine aminocarboxypropyltransferase [Halopseudomonas salegens]|uniref:tRNA-uridine aminocarboxypropyltransferase n=1 Tax=Halopseudomonas salegens TaxID=1434072 RepID=A0A1H2GEA8_9GAMM|nr:DTW domain-containing protein [Halopseudomonas salegens]SDU17761.1 DTW domain-containing protein YfiP [Halopseudomonas salegens]